MAKFVNIERLIDKCRNGDDKACRVVEHRIDVLKARLRSFEYGLLAILCFNNITTCKYLCSYNCIIDLNNFNVRYCIYRKRDK